MIFNARKINIMLSLLIVTTLCLCINIKAEVLPAPHQIRQVKGVEKFVFIPQTIVKTNLPRHSPSLFELQHILRERFGHTAVMGGFRAKGKSVIELWIDSEIEDKKHFILDISAHKLSIRGATQEGLYSGLKALDRILEDDVCNTANKQIAPVHINAVSATVVQPDA